MGLGNKRLSELDAEQLGELKGKIDAKHVSILIFWIKNMRV